MAKNLQISLDEELLGPQGGSAGNNEESRANHNNSIASFVNDVLRDNSPSPDLLAAAHMLTPVKGQHNSTRTSLGSR
jgi:hypothetical protein